MNRKDNRFHHKLRSECVQLRWQALWWTYVYSGNHSLGARQA